MVNGRRGERAPSATAERLVLPGALVDAIVVHSRSELPNEACGLLSGSLSDGRAVAFHPTRNSENSPLRYNIHPDDLLRVTLEIEDAGADLVAIFHSHIRSPAVPSETDRRLAFYPETLYLLADLTDVAAPDLRAWRIRDGEVTEVPLSIE